VPLLLKDVSRDMEGAGFEDKIKSAGLKLEKRRESIKYLK
jgi:hypothetical protein